MKSILSCREQKFLFEKELKEKGCVDLIRNCVEEINKESTEIIENVLHLLFNYYVCLNNEIFDEEISLEEKVRYLYLEEIIDEDTRDNLLYLCEVVNDLYELDKLKEHNEL